MSSAVDQKESEKERDQLLQELIIQEFFRHRSLIDEDMIENLLDEGKRSAINMKEMKGKKRPS